MAFPATATFGQLFPFQTSFEAKLFSSPETVVVWLTRQQKARTQMTTKATGLCTKSRRAVDGGVFSISTGTKTAKQGHLLPKIKVALIRSLSVFKGLRSRYVIANVCYSHGLPEW